MGNRCCSCYCKKSHLNSGDNHTAGSTRPLQSVVNDEGEESETVNVLGESRSEDPSPNLNQSDHSNHLLRTASTPDQLAVDLSRISSEENDLTRPNPSASERGSDEPMLANNIRPFGGTNRRKSSSSSSLQYSGSSSHDKEEAPQERILNNDQTHQIQQQQQQPHHSDEEEHTAHSPSLFLSSSELDLETAEGEGEASPSVTADSAEDLDSLYEKKGSTGVEEKIRFFSQQNISSSSSRRAKTENSEHESSKLNHFKKLGRATLVTDGTKSLLSSRAGRGAGGGPGHHQRKTAVAMSAKPERQRDSYGSGVLTREELQSLAEIAKHQSPNLNQEDLSRDNNKTNKGTDNNSNNNTVNDQSMTHNDNNSSPSNSLAIARTAGSGPNSPLPSPPRATSSSASSASNAPPPLATIFE